MPGKLPDILACLRLGALTLAVLFLDFGAGRAGPPAMPSKAAGAWRTSLALAPALQARSGLDGGGEMHVFSALLKFGLEKRWSRSLNSDLALTHRRSRFEFKQAAAFAAGAPWRTIHETGIATRLEWQPGDSWSLMARPSLVFAREKDAAWDEAAVGGLAVALSKRFGRRLSLGIGVAAVSGLEEDKAYPLLIVFWRIADRWRLANPFRPGPSSPAGLELSYRIDEKLEAGLGTTYGSQRFRLDDRGPAANGIGEATAFLTYLRLSREAGNSFGLDLYAGVHWNGELTLEDENGHELSEADYDPVAIIALALRSKF